MNRLLIANRGEIARRILRAGRERGYAVAVVSTPEDADALVRREANAVLEVSSFLAIEEVVGAAQDWGATLLHPGYGFLSENAEFAARVEAAGIAFVGPTAENMRAMGGKESAKIFAQQCAVPTLEALFSSELAEFSSEQWGEVLISRGIIAPFLVKASSGGGGRGMRVVNALKDLPDALHRASEEAFTSFGDGTVFVERYLAAPRHVEIQVFGNGLGGGVFLGERECSLQRRHQKVLEEAPSSAVDATLREAMGRASLALVRATRYRGAGTVEFLLDEDSRFFFLEMNTRLQVEHPVTEWAYGVDLVYAQFDLAEGRWPSSLGDPAVFAIPVPHGVSLEARVLAEDPRHEFLPTPGPLTIYREPQGEYVRVDSGVAQGGRVSDRFDSLIAKVIIWGEDRAQAAARLSEALQAFIILGCTTNLPFLQAVTRHPDFLAGRVSTDWIGAHLIELNGPLLSERLGGFLQSKAFRQALSHAMSGVGVPKAGPAARFAAQAHRELLVGGGSGKEVINLQITEAHRFNLQGSALDESLDFWALRLDGPNLALSVLGEVLCLEDPFAQMRVLTTVQATGTIHAPMGGKVVDVLVGQGDWVEEAQVLFILESMKMQFEVRAPGAGRILHLHVVRGQVLSGPEPMVEIVAS